MRSPVGVPAAVIVLVLLLLTSAEAAVPLRGPGVYARPVPGEVVQAFEPPGSAFSSGHRGVDLAAAPGDVVRAAGDGTVAFAGKVAGGTWVTIEHAHGVRTSYGHLADLAVEAGQGVGRGQPLGSLDGPPHPGGGHALHWSARRGDRYIDPMSLLAPLRPSLVGPGGWHVGDLPEVPSYAAWDGRHRFGLVPGSRDAVGPGWVLPPNPNRVIGIAGLGSRTGEPPFDLTHLGYAEDDVGYLSYAADGGVYGPADTWRGVDAAARRLEEDLRAAWAADPGRAVDLVGHSMGGVVAMHYLLHHHDPTDPGLPPIGSVVTVAAPLQGADLARGLVDAARDPVGHLLLETVGWFVGEHDPTSRAVTDLAVGSRIVGDLATSWASASESPYTSPLATGTRVLTLGGQVDLVVPEHRSDLDGAPHVVLPGTHDGVRETEAVRIVIREFLAGRAVPGQAGGLGHWISHPLGWIERELVDDLVPG